MPWGCSAAPLLFHYYPMMCQRSQKQKHEASAQLLGCYNKQDGSGCPSNEMVKGNHGRHSRSSWQGERTRGRSGLLLVMKDLFQRLHCPGLGRPGSLTPCHNGLHVKMLIARRGMSCMELIAAWQAELQVLAVSPCQEGVLASWQCMAAVKQQLVSCTVPIWRAAHAESLALDKQA